MESRLLIAAILVAVTVSSTAFEFCPVNCYCDSTDVQCPNSRLRLPPTGYWPECLTLNLRNNNISSLNKYSLTGFPDLKSIYLGYNYLTVLDLEVFSAAPELTDIEVRDNKIDTIVSPPPGVKSANVQQLNLKATSISSIDTEVLDSVFPSLVTLTINDTPLACDCLYEELFWWARGRKVTLQDSCNGVSQCPFLPKPPCPTECSCQGVEMNCNDAGMYHPPVGLWLDYEYLSISGNDISVLYEYSLTGFQNVFTTDLGNNKLNVFDLEVFARLQKLENLDLSNNSVDTIVEPPDGLQLSNLQTLSLADNNISSLKLDFLHNVMPSLRQLSFEGTPLACECAFEDLYLWASEKDITLQTNCNGGTNCSFISDSCPSDCNCVNNEMRCESAGLTEPPSGYWPVYAYLYLDNNNITTLHSDSFTGFPDLRYIYMQNNELKVLDLDVFSAISYLYHLHVPNNNIESILPTSNATQLRFLHVLDIAGNNINYINTDVLESVTPYLSDLIFDDTPLACECSYEDLYVWAQNHSVYLFANCNGEDRCSIIPCPEGCKCQRNEMNCESANLAEPPTGNWPVYAFLYLDSNEITVLYDDSFSGFPDLRYIYLKSNGLTDLNLDVFRTIPYLYHLYVSNNTIKSILPTSNGEQLMFLHVLDITENNITSIDTDILESATPYLSDLIFHDTPLACECTYESLYFWAQNNSVRLFANCSGEDRCSELFCPEHCTCQGNYMHCESAGYRQLPPGYWTGYMVFSIFFIITSQLFTKNTLMSFET